MAMAALWISTAKLIPWDSLYAYDTVTNSSSNAASFAGDGGNYDGTLYVTGTGDITFSGNLTENTLVIDGNNTVILTGSNSFQSVYLESGTLELGSDSAFGEGTTIYGYGGTLDLDGQALDSSVSLQGSLTLTNSSSSAASFAGNGYGGNLTVEGAGNLTLSGSLVYWSGLTVAGSNTVALSGSNYFGSVQIYSGVLELANSAALGQSTNTAVYGGGGSLDLDGQQLSSSLQLYYSGTLANSSSAAASLNGTIYGNLAVAGPGEIVLDSSVYGSLTMESPGLLVLPNWTSNADLYIANGVVQLAGGFDANAVTIGGGELDLNGNTAEIGRLYGGTGMVTSTLSGATGNLAVGGGNFAGAIDDGSSATAGYGGSFDGYGGSSNGYGGPGIVALEVTNGGTLQLGGDNTYSGSTEIDNGSALVLDSATALGNTSVVFDPNSSGGTLDLNGQQIAATPTLAFGGTLTNSSLSTASFGGNISGDLTVTGRGEITLNGDDYATILTLAGKNTLALNGSNDTQHFVLTSGTLQLVSTGALGDGTVVSASHGAVLDLDGQTLDSAVALDSFAGTLTNSSVTAAAAGRHGQCTTLCEFYSHRYRRHHA